MRALRPVAAALLLAVLVAPAVAYPATPDDPAVVSALGFLQSAQKGDGSIGTLSVTAWSVMAIAAAGEDPSTWKAPSGADPVDYLARNNHRLATATDFERQLLAATAAGRDPTAFGEFDLVAKVRSFFDGTQFGNPVLLNDDAFAIVSLRSAGVGAGDVQVQSSLSFLLANQNADGGWGFQAGGVSDVDDTASTLWALARAGLQRSDPAVAAAFGYLHLQQLPDGGFSSLAHGGTVSNVGSDAWTIHAIVLFGEDPDGAAWTAPSGRSVEDDLRSLQNADGSFNWDGVQRVGPVWMTAYAVPALLGDAYPVNLQ